MNLFFCVCYRGREGERRWRGRKKKTLVARKRKWETSQNVCEENHRKRVNKYTKEESLEDIFPYQIKTNESMKRKSIKRRNDEIGKEK